MVDPDASYPENPLNRFIIHWWQEDLTKSSTEVNSTSIGGTRLVNNTAPRVTYRRPRPPTNSSAHRYIQYLFEQPDNFQVPEAYAGYGNQNASMFPLEQFLDDADLEDPIAANYFYCSNQTAVPATFVAARGEEYPGGNGAMVTQGTNEPSSTGASSVAPATETATSSISDDGSNVSATDTASSPSSSAGSGTATGAASPEASTAIGSTSKSDNTLAGMVLAVGVSLALL